MVRFSKDVHLRTAILFYLDFETRMARFKKDVHSTTGHFTSILRNVVYHSVDLHFSQFFTVDQSTETFKENVYIKKISIAIYLFHS